MIIRKIINLIKKLQDPKQRKTTLFKHLGMYDQIVSLGRNCEVSYRIEDFFDKADSYPYTWVSIPDKEFIINTLLNRSIIIDAKTKYQNSSEMLECQNTSTKYHIKYTIKELSNEDGSLNETKMQESKLELKSRMTHLCDKLDILLNSDKRTLFVMTIDIKNSDEDIDYIKRLLQTLEKLYTTGKFKLLVILQEKDYSKRFKEIKNKKLKIKTVKRYAHISHTDKDSDEKGWEKVFLETFPKPGIIPKLLISKVVHPKQYN